MNQHQPKETTLILDSVYITEQHFDGMTVRNVLILGSHRALLFDTLVLPQETKKLLSLCGDRELVVVYSHADWDHVWGTSGLSPREIVAHEECARRFEDSDDVQKTLNEYCARFPNKLDHIKLVPPERTFQSAMNIDLGGITVDAAALPRTYERQYCRVRARTWNSSRSGLRRDSPSLAE